VLLNLLSNAVKFTPSGGRVLVSVARRPASAALAQLVFLRVADTGIGVPREKQDLIFDPFVQVAAGLTRASEGTGLGLAISRDLARGMGGDLRMRSVLGRGSTFTVTLRRASPEG
jgi:signal transduction histidine kinase